MTPPPVTNCSQPLVLAIASDWVMSGSDMHSAIYDSNNGVKSAMVRQTEPMMCMSEGNVMVLVKEPSTVVLLPLKKLVLW